MDNVMEADVVVVAEGEISFVKTQGHVARDLDEATPSGSGLNAARMQGLPRNLGGLVVSGENRNERAIEQ